MDWLIFNCVNDFDNNVKKVRKYNWYFTKIKCYNMYRVDEIWMNNHTIFTLNVCLFETCPSEILIFLFYSITSIFLISFSFLLKLTMYR